MLEPASYRRALRASLAPLLLLGLSGCATVGSLMSPYSEKFSCKNSDHGQCIHPDKAYDDAVAGRASRSDPRVTNDRKLLRAQAGADGAPAGSARRGAKADVPSPFLGYRDSVYRELQGLIDQPVTPMLKPSVTVRTLILPYADRQRPDRLYMPRYVYSIVDKPVWVVGGYLVEPVSPAARAPVLDQVRERPADAVDPPTPPSPEPGHGDHP
ncbi:conjugal transfer protein TraV [Sphingomonas panacis]|uniref:Conjugal transfer protein TraV n=1 Tax=Sphingomonas panacis TaxID=1560345 RepID=A0A1B3ZE12_9SPHN|nr:TraV family lipoprotein [Sphingomonas panacis]AOH85666.1 conjugal transfer protein TraV [Sphingomonas panacis]